MEAISTSSTFLQSKVVHVFCCFLLERYNFRTDADEGLLAAGAAHGWMDIVRLLLSRGYPPYSTLHSVLIRPTYTIYGYNSHALYLAANAGHCDIAKALLDRRVHIK